MSVCMCVCAHVYACILYTYICIVYYIHITVCVFSYTLVLTNRRIVILQIMKMKGTTCSIIIQQ